MNAQLLINAIVQQTMVMIAQLATAGGVRAPLAHVANQVFLDLTRELQSQGVTKKVIADMFGLALRTYHRRMQALQESGTHGLTVWGAVLEFIREREPVTTMALHQRFGQEDPEVLSGVLSDLVGSGLVFRSGRSDLAVFRAARAEDFQVLGGGTEEAIDHLAWLAVYRLGSATVEAVAEYTRFDLETCQEALGRLTESAKVERQGEGPSLRYRCERLEVPLGEARGWEAAVLDHYQAMVSVIVTKLGASATRSRPDDTLGGSTWTYDIWPGHPLETETTGTLSRLRRELEELRSRVDAHNASHPGQVKEQVVVYVGQQVRERGPEPQGPEDTAAGEEGDCTEAPPG